MQAANEVQREKTGIPGTHTAKQEFLKQWHRQGRKLLEFPNHCPLDYLSFNIRWLKEWCIQEVHPYQYLFEHTAIWLVTGGSAVITLGGTRYTVQAGDIVCIPSRMYQTWEAIEEHSPFTYLSFACDARVGAFDFIRLYGFPVVASDVQPGQLASLIQSWRKLAVSFQAFLEPIPAAKSAEERWMLGESTVLPVMLNTGQTLDYLQIRSDGLAWMLELFKTIVHLLPDRPMTYDNRVFEVCDLISARLSDTLTLEDLAETVSLSKEQLRALFKSALGIPPMKYVQHVRMQRAEEMLLLTSLSVKEIAFMVGYDNQHHFSRAFLNHNGVSPLQYRSRQRAGKSAADRLDK